MNIIEEMRDIASEIRSCEFLSLRKIDRLDAAIDRLAASGALVPVPQGEAMGVWDVGFLKYFQCDHPGVWRLCECTRNPMDACGIQNISDGRITELLNNAPVQPVALVPIAEAEV